MLARSILRCAVLGCVSVSLAAGAVTGEINNPATVQFQTDSAAPTKSNFEKSAPSVVSELTSTHLKLKPGAVLHAVKRFGFGEDSKYHVLAMNNVQAFLWETTRGQFFEAIDSPEKAADLVMLQFTDGQLIKSAAQYKAIVDSLKKINDWKAEQFLKIETPAGFGVTVTEVPGLGYQVRVLKFDLDSNYRELGFREVTLHEVNVARDGHMSHKQSTCVAAPERPTTPQTEVPTFFKPEFGLNGAPATAATQYAAIKAYNAAINTALTPDGTEKIAPAYKDTERKSKIPFPMNQDFIYGS